MQSIIMAVPILPGKTENIKAIFKTIKEEKWKEYDRAQKNDGIEKEQNFLQITPKGDMLLVYLESKDIQKTMKSFASSKNPVNVWFIEELRKNTGVDFSQPPSGPLPEMLISYTQSKT